MSSESGWGRPSCRGFLNRSWSDRRRDAARDLARARRHPPQKWSTPRLTRRCEAVARVREAGCAPTLAARRAIHARRPEPRGSTCEVSVIEGSVAAPTVAVVTEFLVGLYLSPSDPDTVERLARCARMAAVEQSGRGVPVRYVRSISGPAEQTCFAFYDAPSREVASKTAPLANLAVVCASQRRRPPRAPGSRVHGPRSAGGLGPASREAVERVRAIEAQARRAQGRRDERRRSPRSPRKSHTTQPAAIRTRSRRGSRFGAIGDEGDTHGGASTIRLDANGWPFAARGCRSG